jgi:hypothetical protein
MLQIAVDLFRDCVCSALLPTCAEACEDDCVPLAVLTVRSSDLRVLEICNWSARQFAITMPTLQYWLGWIPIFGALRDALVRLCCGQRRVPEFGFTDTLRVREARSAAAPPPAAQAPGAPMAPSATSGASTRRSAASETVAEPAAFAALASHYTEAWTSLSGLEATVLGALGARSARGGPLASDLELEHPLAALTLGHLGVEAASSLLPPDLAQRFAAPARGQAAAEPDRLSVLEESMAKLKKTVDTQARTIRDLRAKGPDQ